MKLEFSGQIFEKKTQISNFMKSPPVGTELLHAGRQMGGHNEANGLFFFAVFCFANAPENSRFCPHSTFMCFVWTSEQTTVISLYIIDWLVYVTDMESVYCAVRAWSFNP